MMLPCGSFAHDKPALKERRLRQIWTCNCRSKEPALMHQTKTSADDRCTFCGHYAFRTAWVKIYRDNVKRKRPKFGEGRKR